MRSNKLISFILCIVLITLSISVAVQATQNKDVVTKRKINEPGAPVQTVKEDNTTQNDNKSNANRSTIKIYDFGTKPATANKTNAKDSSLNVIYAHGWVTIPVEKWSTLRTTNVPGIYQWIRGCTNGTPDASYFFYHTKRHQMHIVSTYMKDDSASPNHHQTLTAITDLLPDDKKQFEQYGNKTNSFTHEGKLYTIPKPVSPICDNIPKQPKNEIGEKDRIDKIAKKLHTTKIPGVYSSNNGYGMGCCGIRLNAYYFYNTKTKKLVEIPEASVPIRQVYRNTHRAEFLSTIGPGAMDTTKELGDLEEEYKLYGNKTDTFTHEGKVYKIPAPKVLQGRTDEWVNVK